MFPFFMAPHRRAGLAIDQNALACALDFILHKDVVGSRFGVVECEFYFTSALIMVVEYRRRVRLTIVRLGQPRLQFQMPGFDSIASHAVVLCFAAPAADFLDDAHYLLALQGFKADVFLLALDDFEEGREGFACW